MPCLNHRRTSSLRPATALATGLLARDRWRLLLPACWMILALVCGCAPEEKEILVDPDLPVAEPYDGVSWSVWRLFAQGMPVYDIAVLDEKEILVATGAGSVLHLHNGELETWKLPTTEAILALARGPGDQVLALDAAGQCFRRAGGEWLLDWPYGTGQWAQDVWCDEAGTVYACGPIGLVYEEPDGRWTSVDVSVGITLRSVWGRSAQDIWVVGSRGRILRKHGDEWKLSTPFGQQEHLLTVTGDDEERVAIFDAAGETHLWDGSSWQTIPACDFETLVGIYLLEGRLYGYSRDSIVVWSGESWKPEGDFKGQDGCQAVEVLGSTIYFAGWDGWVAIRREGRTNVLLTPPGEFMDLLQEADDVLALTSNAWLLAREGGDWRVLTRFDGSVVSDLAHFLARDDQGCLVALVDRRIWRQERDGTWARMSGEPIDPCVSLYVLEDGTLCFTSSSLWMLTGGHMLRLGRPPAEWSGRLSSWQLAGSSVADLWLLTEVGLLRYDGLTFVPAMRLESGSWRLAHDSREGTLLWGTQGLIAVDRNGATHDLTPQYSDHDEALHRAQLDRFLIAPSGDWLGIEYRMLLRRVDGRWDAVSMDGVYEDLGVGWFSRPLGMVAGSASHILFWSYSFVLEMEDPAIRILKAGQEEGP
jgi:hypothetical protein